MRFFLFIIIITLNFFSYGQSEEKIVKDFFKYKNEGNYSKAMEYYSQVDQITSLYFQKDTNELKFRYALFDLALKVDSIQLAQNSVKKLEELIDYLHIGSDVFCFGMFRLHDFYKRTNNYSESIRVLKKCIQNQLKINSEAPKLAEYYDEIAYAYYRQEDYDKAISNYSKSIPILKKHYNEEYYMSSLSLYCAALFKQKRYQELVNPAGECVSYYEKKFASKTNKERLLDNLYRLAKSYNYLGRKQEANDTYLVFFDKSIEFIEYSIFYQFIDAINEQQFLVNTNLNSVYNKSKELEYYLAMGKIKHELVINDNILRCYYTLAVNNFYFNDTKKDGEMYFTRIDVKKALEYTTTGLKYAKKNKLTDHIYYKDLQIKRLEILLELNQIEALKSETKKVKKYLTKEYANSLLDHMKIDFIRYQGMQHENLEFKAIEGFIKLDLEFKKNPKWMDSLDFLQFYSPILGELELYYHNLNNYKLSKEYQILKNKVNHLIETNITELGNSIDVNFNQTKYLSYSDSLLDLLSDSIIPYFSDYSFLKTPIDTIISQLEYNVNRVDLNAFEKLETLNALRFVYNNLEKKVFYKNCLIREKQIRDDEHLWNDSIKVYWSIGYAYGLNQLYETTEAIGILEELRSENLLLGDKVKNQILNNLAFYHKNIGNHQKSKELLLEYLAYFNDSIRLQDDPEYLINYILGLINYGEECLSLNDYKSAYYNLKKSYGLTGKYLGKTSDEYYRSVMNFADFMSFSDQLEEAKKLLIELNELANKKFGIYSEEFYLTQKQLFDFYSRNGNYLEADDLFLPLINNFEKVFFAKEIGLNSKEFSNYLIEYYKHFNLCLDYAILRNKEKPLFLEKMVEQYFVMSNMDSNRDNYLTDKRNENKIIEYREELNNYFNYLQLPLDELIDRKLWLSEIKKQLDSLENELFLSNSFLLNSQSNLVNDISQSLSSSEVFVFNIQQHSMKHIKYFINKDSLVKSDGLEKNLLFTISNDKNHPIKFDIYEDSVINIELMNEHYQGATRSIKSNYKTNAIKFTQTFGRTLEKFNDKSKLYIYPSDFLNWINIDVLFNESKNNFFIETHEVVYVKNTFNIKASSEKLDFKNATLIGNPNYNMKINYSNSEERIGGIGVKWSPLAYVENPKFIFESVIPNYPADMAGILPGDRLIKINGLNIESAKDIDEITKLLKGPVGTKVLITIGNLEGERNIEIIRKDLNLQYRIPPLDKLPNTDVEVNKIENFLINKMGLVVEKFTNDFATEEKVKSINNVDIIHIATHSFFLDRDTEIAKYNYTPVNGVYAINYYGNVFFDNGIVFSGVNNFDLEYYNGSKENGFLYSCEIGNLNWENTELVVLSSCESGMGLQGAYSSNSGLIGALQKAGVKNVIASLWKVDDKVTQEFMVNFYSNLAQDKSISESLWRAKLAIKKMHPEPYYWAPFVLYSLN